MLFGVVEEPQGDRAAGRLRDGGHVAWLRAAAGAVDTLPRGERMARYSRPGALMLLPAVLVTVTAAERKVLKKRIRGPGTAWRDPLRAQIVLAAAMGRSTARIARDLRISQDTARKWRGCSVR